MRYYTCSMSMLFVLKFSKKHVLSTFHWNTLRFKVSKNIARWIVSCLSGIWNSLTNWHGHIYVGDFWNLFFFLWINVEDHQSVGDLLARNGANYTINNGFGQSLNTLCFLFRWAFNITSIELENFRKYVHFHSFANE